MQKPRVKRDRERKREKKRGTRNGKGPRRLHKGGADALRGGGDPEGVQWFTAKATFRTTYASYLSIPLGVRKEKRPRRKRGGAKKEPESKCDRIKRSFYSAGQPKSGTAESDRALMFGGGGTWTTGAHGLFVRSGEENAS